MQFKNNKAFKIVNVILVVLISITALVVWKFSSDDLLQDRLFSFMESFFHKTLDRAEWQERFSGNWVYFPLVAEIKVLVLVWVGWALVGFLKSDTGKTKENNKFDAFFNSRTLLYFLVGITVFLFAAAVLFTPVCSPNGSGRHASIPVVILTAGLYPGAMLFLMKLTGHIRGWEKSHFFSENIKILLLIFFLIIIVDLFWFLVFYPGVAMTDTGVVLFQGLSISSQHPWLYCLIVEVLVRVMSAAGFGYEAVFAFMSIVQILLSALVFTHCIYMLMREHVNRYICCVIAVIYIFTPIFCYFTVYLVKDIVFSLVVIEWIIFLYDYWKREGNILNEKRDYLRVIALCVGMMLRNNGIYMVIFTLICMFVFDLRNYRKILVILFVTICTMVLTSTVETAGGITHNFRETVGIPIQQISAVITYGGNISDEEAEFVDRILPLEDIRNNYNPYCVDDIKFRENFDWEFLNTNKKEFFNVWSKLLVKNLPIYVEAYGKTTCGFWSVKRGYIERPDSLNYAFDEDFTNSNGIPAKAVLPGRLQELMDDIMYPLTDLTFGEGQLLWIILLLGMVLAVKNGNRSFIIISPVIGGYITLFLATPGAYSWRYIYFAALAVPLLTGLLFAEAKDKEV